VPHSCAFVPRGLSHARSPAPGGSRRWCQVRGGLGGGSAARPDGRASSRSPMMSVRRSANLSVADADGPGWKHLARQDIISGQSFWQSGSTGFSSGQHGMSPAMASSVIDIDIAAGDGSIGPTAADAANGPAVSPTITRIASRRRRRDPDMAGRSHRRQANGSEALHHILAWTKSDLRGGRGPWNSASPRPAGKER
jgi:hypothetical protein